MDFITQNLPVHDPTWVFFIVLMIILFAPIIMGKLRIPHIIGLVLFGVAIGHYGFDIIERDVSFETFGKVGLYYIMFLASLEMDIDGLRKNMTKIPIFGLLSFTIPFLMTFITCRWLLSYPTLTSILLGCIMSSNTLVAYPIVGRYGLQRKPSVTMSVGGTMISLLASLIVLAVAVETVHTQEGGQSQTLFWLVFFLKFTAFCAGMIFFVPRITRHFLRRYSDTVMQYIFVLGLVMASAAMSQAIGIEGVFGAFFAGLILNRFIPHVSPLMNRIEFIGNAIFIPYFLIGVGMLIDLSLMFEKEGVITIVLVMVTIGTLGKGIAAYLACIGFRMPLSSGHMMFGLTSAHAAGAIAMVMVGMRLEIEPGVYLVTDDILNGVVIMILFTCIISSVITERSAQKIVLRDKEIAPKDEQNDDEKILVPVRYPEYANNLITLAMLMRNEKLNRGLVGLNVVYDDLNMRQNQEAGRKLLDQIEKHAAAADVRMRTQVRVAANIANGIKHAFSEFDASEIIIGMHGVISDKETPTKFWGEFHQSLFNGLNRQIIMARLHTPLNTIRKIHVAVPSRSQYEPGFYRYLDRLSRLAENLGCGINYNARKDTMQLIEEYMKMCHNRVRAQYFSMEHWNEMPALAETIKEDHLFVVVTARKGTISYKNAQERLPEELTEHFTGKNLIILFPDQHGESQTMTFAEATHTEELSAYEYIKLKLYKVLHHF